MKNQTFVNLYKGFRCFRYNPRASGHIFSPPAINKSPSPAAIALWVCITAGYVPEEHSLFTVSPRN